MNTVSRTDSSIRWIPASIARHPALLAAACISVGVFLGDALDMSSVSILVAAVVLGFVGLVGSQSLVLTTRVVGMLAVCGALVTLGAWRITVTNSGRPSSSLTELIASERQVNLFARVDGVPYQKSSGWRLPLRLLSVKTPNGNQPLDSRVLLTSIPSLRGLQFGDYIRFDGRVFAPSTQRNPGGFDYAEYLHRQGFDATVRPQSPLSKWPQDMHWSLYNIADPVRQWIRETFAKSLDDDPQALLVGLILGDTDRLPKPVYNAFRESGTSHLLAVSGANVWLVVGMILLPMYAFSVPRWPRTIVAMVVIVFFSFLTRNEPSVVRASLMVALILAGRLLWRPVAPVNAVGAAALIILLLSPSQLFRPGFQLSFAAVIGIIVVVGRVEPKLRGVWRTRLGYTVVLFFVASLAATVATAPISAWHFGTVPVAGLVSNLLMVPLAGMTAHLGLLLLPLQAVTSTGTKALALGINYLLRFSTRIAEFFADMSWATLSWPSPSLLILAHLVLVAVLFLNWRHRYNWFRPFVFYVCISLTVFAALRYTNPTSPVASISLLDTGRQRVAVLSSSAGSAAGIIDDPGLDDEIDQWIVQPFLRYKIGEPKLDTWTSWRRLDGVPTFQTNGSIIRIQEWKRLFTHDDLDTLGRPHIWADLWPTDSSDILMIRDLPPMPLHQLLAAARTMLRSATIIIPSQAKVDWIREVIDRSRPTNVVLYGRPRFGQDPAETLAFWRLRFPDVEFYSSAEHGGITLDILPGRVNLTRTVSSRPDSFE